MKNIFKKVVVFLTIVVVAEVMFFNVHFIHKTLYPDPAPFTIVEQIKATLGFKVERPEPTFLQKVDGLLIKAGVFKEVPEENTSTKIWNKCKEHYERGKSLFKLGNAKDQ